MCGCTLIFLFGCVLGFSNIFQLLYIYVDNIPPVQSRSFQSEISGQLCNHEFNGDSSVTCAKVMIPHAFLFLVGYFISFGVCWISSLSRRCILLRLHRLCYFKLRVYITSSAKLTSLPWKLPSRASGEMLGKR